MLGILSLSNTSGVDRLERACQCALAIRTTAYRAIKTMLRKGMQVVPLCAGKSANRNTPPPSAH